MTPSVRKAIIPAAGRGTRLLPLTATTAKEMLHVGPIPMIEHSIREAAEAGIEEILIIINERKKTVQDHLANRIHLYGHSGGKSRSPALRFIDQPAPLGVADAIYRARDFICGEPFAILMPDNIVASDKAAIGQLMEAFEELRCDLLGLMRMKGAAAQLFGNVGRAEFEGMKGRLYRITRLYPKERGTYCAAGGKNELRCFARYIMRPHFFDYIEEERAKAHGEEIDDVPPLQKMAKDGHLFGCLIDGEVFDAGNPKGYTAADLYFKKA